MFEENSLGSYIDTLWVNIFSLWGDKWTYLAEILNIGSKKDPY